jgi:hypothetical protein
MILLRTMNSSLRKTRVFLWLLAVVTGLWQAWANRFYIEPDGVNYLDIANAYLRHDWRNAINAHWSPLWSWLLGVTLWLIRPSPFWESTLVHVLNFIVYLLVLLSFSFFLNELMALCVEETDQNLEYEGLTTFAWLVLGYVVVTYVVLVMIGGRLDTPDMCVAALFFLATAMLIRMRRGGNNWRLYAALGAILGVAYLAKTIMFLLAFVFLFCGIFVKNNRKRAVLGTLLGFLVFAIISGPLVVTLSRAKGRFTFGDSGRMAYLWFVKSAGTPTHGIRKVSEGPEAYEFANPVAGTYPPNYDPTYWEEGVRPQFDWRAQLHCMAVSGHEYFRILSSQRALAVGVLVLLFFAGEWRGFGRRIAGFWTVWLPAVITLLLYSMVLVDPRYLPGAVVVLWCSVLASIRLPRLDTSPRLVNGVGIAVAIALGMTITTLTVENVIAVLRRPPHLDWKVAESLHRRGLHPGDTVAVLGQEPRADYWARLAQVRVVAELPEDSLGSYWQATSEKQGFILDAFAGTGAKLLITHFKPPAANFEGWQDLENTGYYTLLLVNRAPRRPAMP